MRHDMILPILAQEEEDQIAKHEVVQLQGYRAAKTKLDASAQHNQS